MDNFDILGRLKVRMRQNVSSKSISQKWRFILRGVILNEIITTGMSPIN